MEVGRDTSEDAKTARDRCLMALAGCGDLDTRVALWKAAKRFNTKYRREVAGLETCDLRTGHAATRGEVSAREG